MHKFHTFNRVLNKRGSLNRVSNKSFALFFFFNLFAKLSKQKNKAKTLFI